MRRFKRSEDYRHHASVCLQMAERATDVDAKIELLAMARHWSLLAHQADRNSSIDVVYEPPPVKAQIRQPAVQQQQQQQIQPDDDDSG